MLVKVMKQTSFDITTLSDNVVVSSATLSGMQDIVNRPVPLFFQTGYLTIKGYDPETDLYRLDIPNKEIRVGLYRSLLPNYIGMNTVKGTTTIAKMSALIRRGDMDGALKMLQAYLATVPYCSNADSEGHYQQMMYVIFSILDNYVDGRSDRATALSWSFAPSERQTPTCRHRRLLSPTA